MSLIRRDLAHRLMIERGPESGKVRDKERRRQTQGWHDKAQGWNIGRASFLSVIVAARDEAASLPELMEETSQALRRLCEQPEMSSQAYLGGFEIIVVDDGSTDATWPVLRELNEKYRELRLLRFRTSAGQSTAIVAGLRAARGDWVATLDADLQNDPADLITLWRARRGSNAVLGWRKHRADTWTKRVISNLANRVRNSVLRQSIRDTGCSVRLFPRSIALRLPLFRGAHRFWGPLLLREGCRIAQVPVRHRARTHGRSHYNLWNRSIAVIVDLFGVAWLMHRPLRYEVQLEDQLGAKAVSYPRTEHPLWQRNNRRVA